MYDSKAVDLRNSLCIYTFLNYYTFVSVNFLYLIRRYRNEDYYYDDYYGDYRYRSSQQYPAEEDTRSVHSEKSKNIDHEPLTDRSHHEYQRSRNRSSYADHPSYMHEYEYIIFHVLFMYFTIGIRHRLSWDGFQLGAVFDFGNLA